MKKIPNTLFMMILILGTLTGCFQEEWSGSVYPNKNNLMNHRAVGTYTSLKQCRDAAYSLISSSNWKNADYECGLNCRGSIPMICEKTVR